MLKENALKAVLLSWRNGFYLCERIFPMADKLQRCALAFQKLIDTQYEIINMIKMQIPRSLKYEVYYLNIITWVCLATIRNLRFSCVSFGWRIFFLLTSLYKCIKVCYNILCQTNLNKYLRVFFTFFLIYFIYRV